MLYFFLTLFLIIVLFPFPIKFLVEFKDSRIKIFIYKKLIFEDEFLLSKDSVSREIYIKKAKKYKINFFKILSVLQRSLFKPILKYKLSIDYDLSDAYLTAVSNGLFNPLLYVFHNLAGKIFNIPSFNIKVNPKFNNNLFLYFSFKGIIYINLVKITIIALKIFRNIKKEVHPLREAYGQ